MDLGAGDSSGYEASHKNPSASFAEAWHRVREGRAATIILIVLVSAAVLAAILLAASGSKPERTAPPPPPWAWVIQNRA